MIYERDILEIGEALTEKNQWIGEELESVNKFLNTPPLKIAFTQTLIAKKCTDVGLKTFKISVPVH